MGQLEDTRTEAERAATRFFAVATDSFMSGWGKASGGRSLYALACESLREAETVAENMRKRSDMKRVRITKGLPRVRANDHLSVAGKTEAERHYRAGGF